MTIEVVVKEQAHDRFWVNGTATKAAKVFYGPTEAGIRQTPKIVSGRIRAASMRQFLQKHPAKTAG